MLILTSEPTLPLEAVLELYRGRWQVELVFKRLKHLLEVGQVPKYDPGLGTGLDAGQKSSPRCWWIVLIEGKFFPLGIYASMRSAVGGNGGSHRDTLKNVLTPAIPLPQLLAHGHSIALSLRESSGQEGHCN